MRRALEIALATLPILLAGLTGAGLAGESSNPIEIMALSPVYGATCIAVEVPLDENQVVSGLMWYNNDSDTVYPKVMAAAAYEGMPPDIENALVIVNDVSGVEDGWSELQFPQPVASPTGRFYMIFQFPAFGEATGRGSGPGIGYQSTSAATEVYYTAEGEEWLRMISAERLLVEPVYDQGGEKSESKSTVLMLPAPGDPKMEIQEEDVIKVTGLNRPHPNPFNPSVTFEFTLKEPGRIRLSIYDLRGRLVSDLVNESLPMGRYKRTWQGKDRHDRQMASGVYFARMEADGQNWTHRMILVK